MAKPPKDRFPIRKAKIYTRTGDKGETSLVSGERVGKDHPRTAAYGTIDELNSNLGVAISSIRDRTVSRILQNIQHELFNIGAELASNGKLKQFKLNTQKIDELEQIIDRYDGKLAKLHTFILPGGGRAAAFLHLARTVCRRAEREVVTLAKKENTNPNIVAYLNRLGDLLFVLARYINKKGGVKEINWKKD
jgi:cob(I)alamin adenosyltransferase